MKAIHRTLLISALLATPFAAVHAAESQAAHEAWLKAQKIDIEPTLKVTETKIPAGSTGAPSGSSNNGMGNGGMNNGAGMPGQQMPSQAPSQTMPSSQMPSGNSMGSPGASDQSTSPYGTQQRPQ